MNEIALIFILAAFVIVTVCLIVVCVIYDKERKIMNEIFLKLADKLNELL